LVTTVESDIAAPTDSIIALRCASVTEPRPATSASSGLPFIMSTTDAQRQSLMESVAKAMDLSAPVTKTLVLLAKTGKLNLVPDLAAAYQERLLAHQNIVRADVTSAAPLSPEKTKALEESLAIVTGKKVVLSVGVDPALLGGVVARIGSTVYDGSVKTQLQRMRQELVEQ
jgi:F-type H+-transporting ATPase subunit delta